MISVTYRLVVLEEQRRFVAEAIISNPKVKKKKLLVRLTRNIPRASVRVCRRLSYILDYLFFTSTRP